VIGSEAMSKLITFLNNESGATSIEYALIASGISIVIVATVNALGVTLTGIFTNISNAL
jgi:pilus assembly protein Flp/PilA